MSIDREMDPRGLIPTDAQQGDTFAVRAPSAFGWTIARFEDGALRQREGARRWIDDAERVIRLEPPCGGMAYECEPSGRGAAA